MDMIVDLGISDKETMYIGKIVTYWSALENEILLQCISKFDDSTKIPKELKNLQFSSIKLFWKNSVVEKIEDKNIKKIFLLNMMKLSVRKKLEMLLYIVFGNGHQKILARLKPLGLERTI